MSLPNQALSPQNLPEAKSADSQLAIGEILQTLLRRRIYLFSFLALGLLGGLLYGLRRPQYKATGELRVEPGRSAAYESSPLAGGGGSDEKISAEVAVLQSETIFLQVAKDLNLANDPDFGIGKKGAAQISTDTPAVRDQVLAAMRQRVSLTRGPHEEIVTIACTTYSPQLSARIVNTLTNAYIARVFEMRYGTANHVTDLMIGQLDGLRDQVLNDQQRLVTLQQKLGIIGLDSKSQTELSAGSLSDLTRASTDATISRIVSEARLRYLQQMNPNLIENEQPLLSQSNSAGSLLQSLRTQQATAEADYAKLSQRYGDKFPAEVQAKAQLDAINAQIKTEQNRIVNQAKIAYQAASANEQMTQQSLNSQEKQAFNSRDSLVQFIILQREYESHRGLYEGLLRHLKEAGIDAGLKSADVDILDIALLPSSPTGLGKLLSLLAGLLAGLLLGIPAALLIDQFDSRLTDPRDAAHFLKIPLIASLPLVRNATESLMDSPFSAYTESMQLMRSSLLLSGVGHAPRSIIITSAIPGEGKSTTARNLAITFASHDARVLLVDADLRRPVQHTFFKVSNVNGLSTALSTSKSLESCILKLPNHNNLSLLPAGLIPPNPAILLGSSRMRELLANLADRFDVIIIDSAPVASATDTLLFCSSADATLLVVRQKKAPRRIVEESKQMLQHTAANLVGFAMNAVDFRESHYGYGTSYGSYKPRDSRDSNA